jgi:hypothetical protein
MSFMDKKGVRLLPLTGDFSGESHVLPENTAVCRAQDETAAGKIKASDRESSECVDGFQSIESEIGNLELFLPGFTAVARVRENAATAAKNASFPPAQPLELSAKATAII